MSEPSLLIVGHLNKAHGTKGELFLWPLTGDPAAVFVPGAELVLGDSEGVADEASERVVIERVRPFKRGMLVKPRGMEDRTAVEPLAGRYVAMPREDLPPLEEGEVFYHQLLGLNVETVEGASVGRVREVYELATADLLEVEGAERTHLIPLVAEMVQQIDVENGRLVIDPPEGLLDL
ncbi:MAG: ribosome maturation factor RimM [Gemmatimonadota bacterium]